MKNFGGTRRNAMSAAGCWLLALSLGPAAVKADSHSAAEWSAQATIDYRVVPNIVYKVANGHENKLDVYVPSGRKEPNATVIYIHGGGWVGGTKEASSLQFLPYLQKGMSVVNVEYRLGRISRGPAAVEDCRCALQWVIRNAEKYAFDPSKLVVTGRSAGGHLSLITGMLDPSAGLDRDCPGDETLQVAAIVNWFGITDVGDLLDGVNEKSYAVRWLGSLEDRFQIAKRVSPLTYIRRGLPPVLTIHGDADKTVPYQHAVRLHKALKEKGVENELLKIPGGGHGGFSSAETQKIFVTIDAFLRKHGILAST